MMEQLFGGDLLDQVVLHKGLSESRAKHAICQVLLALDWLHFKGICHGCARCETTHPSPGALAASQPLPSPSARRAETRRNP